MTQGIMIILDVDGKMQAIEKDTPPSLKELQKAVGGYIEFMPAMTQKIKYQGKLYNYMAYCNEDSCFLPANLAATNIFSTLLHHEETDTKKARQTEQIIKGALVILLADDRNHAFLE